MRPAPSFETSPHRFALMLFAVVFGLWLAGMSLAIRAATLAPERAGTVLAVFAPGTTEPDIFAAILRAGGRPVRATWLDFVWIAHGREPGFVGRLHAEGARMALEEFPLSPQLGGCVAFASNLKSPILLRRSSP